jgi:hypothetical protein
VSNYISISIYVQVLVNEEELATTRSSQSTQRHNAAILTIQNEVMM